MKRIKKTIRIGCLLAFSILILNPTNIQAQLNVERQVFSPFGNQISSSTLTVSQTFGETFTATLSNGPFTSSQGFEQWQGDDIPLSIDLKTFGINRIYIYPNPAGSSLTLAADLYKNLQLSFLIYDVFGRKVLSVERAISGIGLSERQVDLSSLSEGNYVAIFLNEKKEYVFRQLFQKLE